MTRRSRYKSDGTQYLPDSIPIEAVRGLVRPRVSPRRPKTPPNIDYEISPAVFGDNTIPGWALLDESIEDGKIKELSVEKLTAGTLAADIILGGEIATGVSGPRVVITDDDGGEAFLHLHTGHPDEIEPGYIGVEVDGGEYVLTVTGPNSDDITGSYGAAALKIGRSGTEAIAKIASGYSGLYAWSAHGAQWGYSAARIFAGSAYIELVDDESDPNGGAYISFSAPLKDLVVRDTLSVPAPSWTTPSLSNSWRGAAGFRALRYCKDHMGYVHLEGRIYGGASGTTIFTLPSGFRPGAKLTICCAGSDTSGRIDIDTNGAVIGLYASISYLNICAVFWPG